MMKPEDVDDWVVITEEYPGGPNMVLNRGRYQECLEYYNENLEGPHAMCLLSVQEFELCFFTPELY